MMEQIATWFKAQSDARLFAYYVGMSWLSAAYVYRWPSFDPDPLSGVGIEVIMATVAWPIYWFFRLATVGF